MKTIRIEGAAGKAFKAALKNLEGKVGKVGWLDGSRYPESPHPPVAYIAAIQEFGAPTKNIPPRPFIRPTVAAKQKEWASIAYRVSAQIIRGEADGNDLMQAIGLKASGDIRKAISVLILPPLKPATIRARMNRRANKKTVGNLTKPLIDTGLMLNTLTNSVEDE